MIRNLLGNLRKLTRDERGTSLVAYAVLLGGIAVVIVAGLADFSVDLSTALDNQAASLERTVQGSAPPPAATSPTSPSPNSPTAGGSSGSSGGSSGRRGRRR